MSSLAINKTRIIEIDKEFHLIDNALVEQLQAIASQTYQLPQGYDILKQYIDLGPKTALVLFYGEYGDLAGFAAIHISYFTHDFKQYAIYQARSLFDHLYHDNSAAEQYGLTHAMKYKLMHPETILAFVGEAFSPINYCHYSRTVKTLYPHPSHTPHAHVNTILEKVKSQRNLQTIAGDYCVQTQTKLNLNHQMSELESFYNQELVDYYKSLNPNYLDGNSLLVYIPLDLANISLGLRNVINPQIEFSLV